MLGTPIPPVQPHRPPDDSSGNVPFDALDVRRHSYGALADIIEPDCPNSHLTHEGLPTGCLAYTRPWGLLTPTVTGTCDYSDRFNDPNCLASHYPGAVNASGLPYLDKAVVGQVIRPGQACTTHPP